MGARWLGEEPLHLACALSLFSPGDLHYSKGNNSFCVHGMDLREGGGGEQWTGWRGDKGGSERWPEGEGGNWASGGRSVRDEGVAYTAVIRQGRGEGEERERRRYCEV